MQARHRPLVRILVLICFVVFSITLPVSSQDSSHADSTKDKAVGGATSSAKPATVKGTKITPNMKKPVKRSQGTATDTNSVKKDLSKGNGGGIKKAKQPKQPKN